MTKCFRIVLFVCLGAIFVAPSAAQLPAQLSPVGQLFDRFDSDDDKTITTDELVDQRLYNVLDRNQDGVIEHAESRDAFMAMQVDERRQVVRNLARLSQNTKPVEAEETTKPVEATLTQRLTAIGDDAAASPAVPGGSIRVVADRKIVFDKGFGTFTKQVDRPWQPNTPVALASITKSVTATLVALLVDQGHLDFDDPVSEYLPEFGSLRLNGKPIRSPTIAECLSHTSGFPAGTRSRLPSESPLRKADQREVARLIAERGLVRQPGTSFAYSFRGYAIVAAAIEEKLKKRFADVLAVELLEPLKMQRTTFAPSLETILQMPIYADQAAGRDVEQVKRQIARLRSQQPTFVNAAGGLVSNADDMTRFLQLHVDKGAIDGNVLIQPETLQRLYAIAPGCKEYGMGFKTRRFGERRLIGHGGATGTGAYFDLQTKRLLIALTQSRQAGSAALVAPALTAVFADQD